MVNQNSIGWYVHLGHVHGYLLNHGAVTGTSGHPDHVSEYYYSSREEAEEALALHLLVEASR